MGAQGSPFRNTFIDTFGTATQGTRGCNSAGGHLNRLTISWTLPAHRIWEPNQPQSSRQGTTGHPFGAILPRGCVLKAGSTAGENIPDELLPLYHTIFFRGKTPRSLYSGSKEAIFCPPADTSFALGDTLNPLIGGGRQKDFCGPTSVQSSRRGPTLLPQLLFQQGLVAADTKPWY